MRKRRGKFITFEGIEGCGKTTQSRCLIEFLKERGLYCVHTKEPGATAIGAEIRKILLNPKHHQMAPVCETLLYLADRAQHHELVVKPGLERGAWVVSDRYHDSTLAYQGAARGLKREDLDALFRLTTHNLQPDLTILLDLAPEIGVKRAMSRNQTDQIADTEGRFEAEQLSFHRAVRTSFLDLAKNEPQRFTIISAERDPAAIASEIRQIIAMRGLLV